jgi:glucose-6-phosphate-specific signal transduction histidine kinase
MRNLAVLFIHFIAVLARLLGPGGVRSLIAESLLLKHQILIGISHEVLESFKRSGNGVGVGLAGIRERLREVNGKFDISSIPDGTILRVSLPSR